MQRQRALDLATHVALEALESVCERGRWRLGATSAGAKRTGDLPRRRRGLSVVAGVVVGIHVLRDIFRDTWEHAPVQARGKLDLDLCLVAQRRQKKRKRVRHRQIMDAASRESISVMVSIRLAFSSRAISLLRSWPLRDSGSAFKDSSIPKALLKIARFCGNERSVAATFNLHQCVVLAMFGNGAGVKVCDAVRVANG